MVRCSCMPPTQAPCDTQQSEPPPHPRHQVEPAGPIVAKEPLEQGGEALFEEPAQVVAADMGPTEEVSRALHPRNGRAVEAVAAAAAAVAAQPDRPLRPPHRSHN